MAVVLPQFNDAPLWHALTTMAAKKTKATKQTSTRKTKRAPPPPDAAPDGRKQRAARSHTAIVDAVYELVRETGEPPDIEAVAARAGVGVRTVFRQFSDLETLHRSVNERLEPEVRALLEQPPGDVPALTASIARRARVFEHIAPFRRASRLARPTSRFIVEQEALIAAGFRAALRAALPDVVGAVDEDAFEALDLLLSWESWERLRRTQGLSTQHAQQVLSAAAAALLAAPRGAEASTKTKKKTK